MIERDTFTTEENVDFKELIARKIGYSQEVFYFGETDKGESLYSISKTTAVVSKDTVSIIGEREDIQNAHKCLENKLSMQLIQFVKSSKYQK